MQNRYTTRQVCLMQRLRQLWEQHVYWTRFFIISTAAGLADLAPVTNRLLQIPKDFAQLLTPFFGARTAGQFGDLLTEHLEIGGELVTDLKNHEIAKADDARRRWYANADTISAFLSGISACWSEEKWREFFYSHLEMTEKEAVLRLRGDYAADIRIFDQIEAEALRMADDMFCGLATHCR